MPSRQKIKNVLSVIAVLLALSFVTTPAMADWDVRKKNRKQIITYRLKQILKRDPFSKYAFRTLLKFHAKPNEQLQLIHSYRLDMYKNPKAIGPKVVLARLLVRHRDWQVALSLYQKVLKKKKNWLPALLGQTRCLLALKQRKKAITYFKKLLPRLQGFQRRIVLQQLLKTALKAKDKSAKQYVVKEIQKEKWNTRKWHDLAKQLIKHKAYTEGVAFYEKLLKNSSGGRRVQLLLELSRAELEAKRYNQSLKRIEQARKIGTLHKWLYWELQMREVEIYRRQDRLEELVIRLSKQWKNAKSPRKILLLANLYRSLEQFVEAEKLYKKATALSSNSKEARLQLLSWYTEQGQKGKALKQLKLLIKNDIADSRHYLRLAGYYFQRSRRYSLEEWKPDWQKNRSCNHFEVPERYKVKQVKRTKRNVQPDYKCSRQQWENYRVKRWKFWERYIAGEDRKKDLQKAFNTLDLCIKRNPRRWESLIEIEALYTRYGFYKRAKKVFVRLANIAGADLSRIQHMQLLSAQRNRLDSFKEVLKRAVEVPWIVPTKAIRLASFVYSPPSLPDSFKHILPPTDDEKRQWQKAICPNIVTLFNRISQRLSRSYFERDPELGIHLNVLMWSCSNQKYFRSRMIKHFERRLLGEKSNFSHLFKLYIRYGVMDAFNRLLSNPEFKQDPQKLTALVSPLFKKKDALDNAYYLMKHAKYYASRHPQLLGDIVYMLCKDRDKCGKMGKHINKLVKLPNMPIHIVMKILEKTAKHRLFYEKRVSWITELKKRHWNKAHALHHLAQAKTLYKQTPALQKLHKQLLLRALQQRKTRPEKLQMWGDMLKSYLNAESFRRKKQLPFLKKLDKAAQKFPYLYRQMIAEEMYAFRYSHRYYNRKNIGSYYRRRKYKWDHATKRFKNWMNKGKLEMEDLLLLEKYLAYFREEEKKKVFRSVLKHIHRPELLSWLSMYAQKNNLLGFQIDALKRMSEVKNAAPETFSRLAYLLDRCSGREKEADRYWVKLLLKRKGQLSLKKLRRQFGICCTDLPSQRLTRRLLLAGLSKHGAAKLWGDVHKVFQKLNRSQQKKFLAYVQENMWLGLTYHRVLAWWSSNKGFKEITVGYYKQLLKKGDGRARTHRHIAEWLDRSQKVKQAMKHWKIYLKKMDIDDEQEFFEKLAAQYIASGDRALAISALFRAMEGQKRLSRAEMRAKVALLQAEDKPLHAWVAWLTQLNAKQLKYCLDKKSDRFNTNYAQQRSLWQMNVSSNGPLFFFPRCRWVLSKKEEKSILPEFLNYLRFNPKQVIDVVGSASNSQEPDSSFLAQQRAMTLRYLLLNGGVAPERVRTSYPKKLATCPKSKDKAKAKDKTKKGKKEKKADKCQQFLRHVAVYPRLPKDMENPGGPSLIQFKPFIKADSDKDGVPDHLDACPLQYVYNTSRLRSRRSYRYRYRYRYSTTGMRFGLRISPWYPAKNQTTSTLAKQRFLGCPKSLAKAKRLLRFQNMKGVKGYRLLNSEKIEFKPYSPKLQGSSKNSLKKVAIFLRMAKHLGKIQIELQPRMILSPQLTMALMQRQQSLGYIYGQLAIRRGKELIKYFQRQGFSKNRFKIHIRDTVFISEKQKKMHPYTSFRFIDLDPTYEEPDDLGKKKKEPPPNPIKLVGSTKMKVINKYRYGSNYSLKCPAGQVVRGIYGKVYSYSSYQKWIGKLGVQCGTIVVYKKRRLNPTYGVTLTFGEKRPVTGRYAYGPQFTRTCPKDSILVGIKGRTSSYLDQLTIVCAKLRIKRRFKKYTLRLGKLITLKSIGRNRGKAFSLSRCRGNEIVNEIRGRSSSYVNGIGITCTRPKLNVKALNKKRKKFKPFKP